MPGTVAGGKKAAQKNKLTYGETFYADIGAMGGRISNPLRPKGFAKNRDLARIAGAKGGRNGTRAGIPNKPKDDHDDMWPEVTKVIKTAPITEVPKKKHWRLW
jgi:uncharacterized protein